jgi:hypothetical protein
MTVAKKEQRYIEVQTAEQLQNVHNIASHSAIVRLCGKHASVN